MIVALERRKARGWTESGSSADCDVFSSGQVAAGCRQQIERLPATGCRLPATALHATARRQDLRLAAKYNSHHDQ